MPKLARMRLVNIGHPRARFDDLTLEFRDDRDRPADTVIWLRNGGGKSSLLNLFYSVVRPRQTDFLGSKGDRRRLADYVLPGDHAVVVCEWELDGAPTLLDGVSGRYLTGVFNERRADSGDDGDKASLQRLFFAAQVDQEVPALTLEGVPLSAERPDGRSMRRNMANFRRAWRELQASHPARGVFCTEKQSEWTGQLESRGIDTELFGYQLDMNSREGGVHELFTFRHQEEFVDFLLDAAFDPVEAKRAISQVATFRQELQHRHETLIPDAELCRGLLERTRPFTEIAKQRNELRSEAAGLFRQHEALGKKLEALTAETSADIENMRRESAQSRADAEGLRQESKRQSARAIAFRRSAAGVRLAEAKAAQAARQEERARAEKDASLWKAAVPLSEAMKHEREARERREQLRRRKGVNAPLFADLEKAAGRLAAAAAFRAAAVRGKARQTQDAARQRREAARGARQEAAERGEAAAQAEAEARSLAKDLASGEADWRRLAEQGAVGASESPERAEAVVARLDEQISETRKSADSLDQQRQEQERSLASLRKEREGLIAGRTEQGKNLADLDARIEKAVEAREALGRDKTLLALLQTDSVEVDSACLGALKKAKKDEGRASESILELRLASAGDRRALAYLKECGTLPPGRDALDVLKHLRSAGLQCWTGWEYLEKNLPADQRRAAVKARPHLAAGVVVQRADYARAASIDHAALRLSGPVAIAPVAGLVEHGEQPDFEVWGPTEDGLFDQSAAAAAVADIERRVQGASAEEKQKAEWRRSLQGLIHRLEGFAREYPPGALQNMRSQRGQLASDLAALEEETAGQARRISEGEAAVADLHEREKAQRDTERELLQRREAAHSFSERFGRHIAAWRELRTRKAAEAEEARREQAALKAEAEQAEQETAQGEKEARSLGEQARSLEIEAEGVRHAPSPLPAAPGVPLETLRADYRRLLDEYERKVGAESLESLARQRDRDAEEQRRRFERIWDRSIAEAEIAEAIRALPRGADAQGKSLEADGALWAATQSSENVASRIRELEERLCAIGEEEAKKGLAEARATVGEGLAPEEAEVEADKADRQAERLSERAATAESRGKEAERGIAEAENRRVRIKACRDRLATVRNAREDLAEQLAGVECEDTRPIPVALEELEARVGDLDTGLAAAAKQWVRMDGTAKGQLKKVHQWCREERFASLSGGVARRFEAFDSDRAEAQAEYLIRQLETRVEGIEANIAEADQQRGIVVGAVMHAVDQALRLLETVSRLSRLPDTVPGRGRRFLDISTQAPEDPAERRGRIGELVDEIVQSGDLGGGIGLIQRAAKRVGRPFRVRVMHPDLGKAGRPVEIPRMANFSGGERLTAAILLFCSLAKLRGRQLGQVGKRTSVLLLDNPLGTVSRKRYLDLQREVANALDIQLIYATGVNDTDAIGTLPNVIRLRNSQRDRRTGRRYVQSDPDNGPPASAEGGIDAVRVHTKPSSPRRAESDRQAPESERD